MTLEKKIAHADKATKRGQSTKGTINDGIMTRTTKSGGK